MLKPLSQEDEDVIVSWLKFYDRWLWGHQVSTRDAVKFFITDTGVQNISRRRLAIHARKVCDYFCANVVGESCKTNLSSRQWNHVLAWIETHRAEVIAAGSIKAASTFAHWEGGGRISVWAFKEALHARSIELPMQVERKKWKDSL